MVVGEGDDLLPRKIYENTNKEVKWRFNKVNVEIKLWSNEKLKATKKKSF